MIKRVYWYKYVLFCLHLRGLFVTLKTINLVDKHMLIFFFFFFAYKALFYQ